METPVVVAKRLFHKICPKMEFLPTKDSLPPTIYGDGEKDEEELLLGL
jgi:hypothetical protein